MARKKKYISILQFDEQRIVWLRTARSTKGVQVLDSATQTGPWTLEDGSLEAALQAFAVQHNLADDALYTVLARRDIAARILDLPSNDPAEIAGMVEFNASEVVPYPVDELIIDQSILRSVEGGESRVLAVFAHKEVINTHLQLLESAGLEPEQVLLSSACLASAAIAAKPGCEDRYAVVDLSTAGLEIVILNGSSLDYGRGLAAMQAWDFAGESANEMLDELGGEIRNSIAAYRRESEEGAGPEIVYFCSDSIDVQVPAEQLHHEIGCETAQAVFALDLAPKAAQHLAALPLVALGAALTAQHQAAISINLIPQSVTKRRTQASLKRSVFLVAAILLVNLTALGGLFFLTLQQRTVIISELDARIGAIETEAKGVVLKQQQLEILQSQVDEKGSVLELIASLCENAPEKGLNFTRIEFEHEEYLNVWGRAKTLNEIQELTKRLRGIDTATLAHFQETSILYNEDVRERFDKIFCYAIGIPFPEQTVPDIEE